MNLIEFIPKSWYSENAENIKDVINGCQEIYDKILEEVNKFKDGMNINTSTGEYLSMNGQDYGVIQYIGESEDDYKLRIQDETLKQKITINALVSALNQIYTSNQHYIYEPWTNLFNVGESTLSGEDKIPDYKYWDYHVIDITTPISIVNTDQITKLLAAGKTLYLTIIKSHLAKAEAEPEILFQIDADISSVCGIEEPIHNTMIVSIIDFYAKNMRYLSWSPCMAVGNPYQFTDYIEVPNLQLGWKIKTEVKGVDY